MATQAQQAVTYLETYLMECVTQTPIRLRFTAAECVAYLKAHGYPTVTIGQVSQWLQNYRTVQQGKTTYYENGKRHLLEADYIVATYQRGRKSSWFILAWPNMRTTEQTLGSDLLTIHEILSVVREEIKPMVRNVDTQFIPAVKKNRSWYRGWAPVILTKLHGYRTMLLNFQHDTTRLSPKLRRAVKAVEAELKQTILEVDRVHAEVSKL